MRVTAHEVAVKLSLEIIGVALLAIIADQNKTLGSLIVVLMVAFLIYWLMTSGYKFLGGIIPKLQPQKG